MWHQRTLTADAKLLPILDPRIPRTGRFLSIGTDGRRVAYTSKKGELWVTAWPAPAAVP